MQKQLWTGSYRSAWLLACTLRSATVDPERDLLSGLVEADEAGLPFRTRNDPPTGGQGRSHDGKMLIIGALEPGDGNAPGRLRLAELSSYGADDPGAGARCVNAPAGTCAGGSGQTGSLPRQLA